MKTRYLLISILLIVGTSSCSGPQKLYENGNYAKAYDKALSKLKKDKDRKMNTLLNKAFSKMIDQTRDDLIDIDRRFDLSDAERNLKMYDEVEERYEEGERYLTDENVEKNNGLRTEKEALVSEVYDRGLAYLDEYIATGHKEDAREAFAYFSLVDKYCNVDYPDMDRLLNDSFEAGTVVYNLIVDLNFEQQYSWEVNRRFDDIEGTQGFTRIVYDRQGNIGDCLVELDFDSLDEDFREQSSTRNYTEEIQDGYTTKTDTSGNSIKIPNYKTVSGSVTTKVITKTVRWRVDLDVRSMTRDCNLRDERFSHTIEDEIEQYIINGDDRAIPSEYKHSNNQKLESTDDMVDEIIDELYSDIYNYLY